jgi:hypothetical protein
MSLRLLPKSVFIFCNISVISFFLVSNVTLPECATLWKHFREAIVEQSLRQLLRTRVCLKNTAVDENTVFGFWVSVPFSGNSGVLLPEKDAQARLQKMHFQHGEYFSDTR